MCFPIVYTNVLTGFDGISEEYLELAEIYDLSSAEKLRYIYWPGAAAQVEAAVRLIAGMSWKAVVAAEVLSIPKYSLGYEMLNAKYYRRTPDRFAYSAVIEMCIGDRTYRVLSNAGYRHTQQDNIPQGRTGRRGHQAVRSSGTVSGNRRDTCRLRTFHVYMRHPSGMSARYKEDKTPPAAAADTLCRRFRGDLSGHFARYGV